MHDSCWYCLIVKDDWKLLVDDQYLDRSWNEMTRDNSKTVVTGQSSGGHNRQVYKHGGDRNVSGDCCTLSVRVNVKSSQGDFLSFVELWL